MTTVAILTISDSALAGTREDTSGPALRTRCEELGWRVMAFAVVGDEQRAISAKLLEWCEAAAASLVLTTGGTGVAARDITPEATRIVLEREIPGLAELMRARGLEQNRFSALSRGVAGTRGKCLIVNLPGSPKGALFSFDVIEPLIQHVIDLLHGRTAHG